MIRFSIITVCKNSEKTISKTIESVLNQTYQDYEYIIVDGLSIDNTLNIINSYKDRFKDKLTVISEKDNGIYDAMNKGIDLANGDYCIFMNAGDVFYNKSVLDKISNYNILDYDIVYGNTMLILNDNYQYRVPSEEAYLTFKQGMEFNHQSCIIKTNLLLENKYSYDYSIAGDYEFFVKQFIKRKKFKHVNDIICLFDANGIGSTIKYRCYNENNAVKYRNGLINLAKYILLVIAGPIKVLHSKFESKNTNYYSSINEAINNPITKY